MDPVAKPDTAAVRQWQVYLDQCVQTGELAPTMKRAYEWGFAQFLDWLDLQKAESVNAGLLRRWAEGLRAHGHNSFSVDFWMECVASFYSWASEAGHISLDPTSGLSLESNRRRKRK